MHSSSLRIFAIAAGVLAFFLYVATLAPGLTWANFGADGGELIAAAVNHGVPHPPGYPLYMLLLQAWLLLIGALFPGSDLAWRANLFSAFCAALTVPVTISAARAVLEQVSNVQAARAGPSDRSAGGRWAVLAGLAWASAPLWWGQAIIAEVYALHMLLAALLGWLAVRSTVAWGSGSIWLLIAVIGLGVAHHLTLVLLLPAALYGVWGQITTPVRRRVVRLGGAVAGGIALGALFHLRTWLAASSGSPVNWGYPDNGAGLWWLVSGAAYRAYLFSASGAVTFDRIAAWAYTLTTQFTPIGLAVALLGLSQFDLLLPRLRNFSLLWLGPISIYAIVYYTKDTEIYLLPIIWLMSLWLAVGLALIETWLQRWRDKRGQAWWLPPEVVIGLAVVIGLVALLGWRLTWLPLRRDNAARDYLQQVAATVQPGSIVVSTGDDHTFALWYGAWASHQLPADLVVVNDALYQFDWYQRILAEQYPQFPAVSQSLEALIAEYRGQRAIYFADGAPPPYTDQTIPAGPLLLLR